MAHWLHRSLSLRKIPRKLASSPERLTHSWDGTSVLLDLNENEPGSPVVESLIVVCSPAAANSTRIDHLLRKFMERASPDRIFAVLAHGEPNCGDERECLPELLRQREPSAADLRPRNKNARRLAMLQLTAALLGIPLDSLRNRQRAARLRIWTQSIAVSLALSSTLAALAIYADMQTGKAHRERERQDRTRREAEEVLAFVEKRVTASLPPGKEASREIIRSMVDRLGEFYAAIGATSSGQEKRFCDSVQLVGKATIAAENFEMARARDLFEQARAIREELIALPDAPPLWTLALADTLSAIAHIERSQGRLAQSRAALQNAHALRADLVAFHTPPRKLWLQALQSSFHDLGTFHGEWGHPEQAINYLEESLTLLKKLIEQSEPSGFQRRDHADLLVAVATSKLQLDDYATAHQSLEEAVRIYEQVSKEELHRVSRAWNVPWALSLLGTTERALGHVAKAVRHQDRAVEMIVELATKDPSDADLHSHLGHIFEARAWLHLQIGRFEDARHDFLQAFAGWKNSGERNPTMGNRQVALTKAASIGDILFEQGMMAGRSGQDSLARKCVEEALGAYGLGVRTAQQLAELDPKNLLEWRKGAIVLQFKQIDLLAGYGDLDSANAQATETYQAAKEWESQRPRGPEGRLMVMEAITRLTYIADNLGESARAMALRRESLAIASELSQLAQSETVDETYEGLIDRMVAEASMECLSLADDLETTAFEEIAETAHAILARLVAKGAPLTIDEQRAYVELDKRP